MNHPENKSEGSSQDEDSATETVSVPLEWDTEGTDLMEAPDRAYYALSYEDEDFLSPEEETPEALRLKDGIGSPLSEDQPGSPPILASSKMVGSSSVGERQLGERPRPKCSKGHRDSTTQKRSQSNIKKDEVTDTETSEEEGKREKGSRGSFFRKSSAKEEAEIEGEVKSGEPPDKIVAIDDEDDDDNVPSVGKRRRGRPRSNVSQVSRSENADPKKDWRDRYLTKSKINLDKYIEEVEDHSSGEIAKKVEDYMMEVIRIAKTSGNLKGTYQKSLKLSAAATLGCLQVLQGRAERSTDEATSGEIALLKRKISDTRKSFDDQLNKEKERTKAAEEQIARLKKELTDLKRLTGRKSSQEAEAGPSRTSDSKEVSEKLSSFRPHQRNSKKKNYKEEISKGSRMEISDEEQEEVTLPPREEWPPAIRPAIRGKAKIIKDRILPESQKVTIVKTKPGDRNIKKTDQGGLTNSKKQQEKKKNTQVLGQMANKPTELAEIIRELIREELGTGSDSQGDIKTRARSKSRLARRNDQEHKGEPLS
ncbi:hypothetical protein ALC57_14664 [Trachymyrmex cornetzi]|uniref:Uncharacterized protein n=1 Tax=Trachymyrmex cornetzi TaxID=471704 RepID=A0A151IXY1_9HYME|nr:hypothetical protein ALC57_14664 [Trachymyrmex cornetzi]